jgi:hypothetical protein
VVLLVNSHYSNRICIKNVTVRGKCYCELVGFCYFAVFVLDDKCQHHRKDF